MADSEVTMSGTRIIAENLVSQVIAATRLPREKDDATLDTISIDTYSRQSWYHATDVLESENGKG